MLIGYARPSLEDPECQHQLALLKKAGCNTIYIEEHASPKKRVRLQELLETATAGDQVVVAKLYTWADSTRHLVELLDTLETKGMTLYSLQENIEIGTGKEYPFANNLRNLADFQSDAISEKTKAGLSVAKEKGVVSGRPRKPDENVKKAIEMHNSKQYTLAEIKEKTGISKSTLYRYLES
ncbi:recombinase family protein [Planococcus sp. NCCP-2050]|uniref:recombinase family protein n=1 Tax=Planococcus sp. NCCP-2050 TaxID=2944679 RepID=UPI0020423B48|nr:recombinase family protein [Planococcus sp. NCCP-2050]GKW46981.1 resolvase [Planococcus sp. NCCP-2050]